MGQTPTSNVSVINAAASTGGGSDMIAVWSPVPLNADCEPRIFSNAAAIAALHGYSEGYEYAALDMQNTRKPILFQGLPIGTPGSVGRVDGSGNSGSSVATVSAGPSGVLKAHSGVLSVVRGGTIGASQILLELSLDGGRVTRRVRLGTANSYTVPYVGASVAFGAGTLVSGDTILTWEGSAPLVDAADLAVARQKLAEDSKIVGTILLISECVDFDAADDFLTQVNAYATENGRFVQGRAYVRDRLPMAAMSHTMARMAQGTSLTFAEVGATGDTITRAGGSWVADGFAVGDTIVITGSASNNITAVIASLSATVITLGSEDLAAEVTAVASVVGYPTLTFAEVGATGDTITRSRGSWLADGFRDGDLITVDGSAGNDFAGAGVTDVSALVLTLDTQDLVAEVVSTLGVVVTAGQTKAQHVAAAEDEFAAIDGQRQLELTIGMGRSLSPVDFWRYRNPSAWGISIRERQHDIHVPTWYVGNGNLPFVDLYDEDQRLVEYDDRVDGGASIARFSSYRTYANGQRGAFISQALTRDTDGSLLSHTHNSKVVNKACNIVNGAQESLVIGYSLILNPDGTATTESLSDIEQAMNKVLRSGLLEDQLGEGANASAATWTADPDTLFNVPVPTLIGTLELTLNGVVHSVITYVKVNS